MPDSYGNAVSFFDKYLRDGHINKKRALIQYKNPFYTNFHQLRQLAKSEQEESELASEIINIDTSNNI